jgi:hypothetical protein
VHLQADAQGVVSEVLGLLVVVEGEVAEGEVVQAVRLG